MKINQRAELAAANRLTERDRQILHLLGQHQVLTTHQITHAFFENSRVARRRIQVLHGVGLLDCFRPPLQVGTNPKHCVLTALGAQAVASFDQEWGLVPPRAVLAEKIALRPDLKHLVGVNGVFCSLLGAARETREASLDLWLSERACAKAWGTYVRPDGFGRWREGTRSVDFFLEYDTGVENSAQILAKLPGYEAMTAATGISTPVLFWLHSSRREQGLHHRLARAGSPVPIATASGDSTAAAPANVVWRRVGAAADDPVRLIDLAGGAASSGGRL
ncbi:hypothetical protein ABH935_000713 [Catenulispora sp. GAS73]|uniref:replication-relaxation family protein n=1 Tax=Catenulispora sp. GAS73 TaxID=3156269 RepID=UPI00351370F6